MKLDVEIIRWFEDHTYSVTIECDDIKIINGDTIAVKNATIEFDGDIFMSGLLESIKKQKENNQ